MSPDLRLRRQEGFAVELVDGEALLFHVESEQMLHCNPSATLVWALIDGRRTLVDIESLLVAAWPEAADTIRADVRRVVEALVEAGAVLAV